MNKPRNVIIIGTAYPFRGGGISTFNERMARAIQNQGDKVTIYTFSLQYPAFLFPGKSQYSTEAAPKDLDIVVAVNSVNPFNWIKVGRKLRNLKPDLVIIRYWMPFMAPCLGTIASIIRKNKHSKVVAITDNIIPHEKMPGGKLLSKYFVNHCDAFLAMSRSVLSDLQQLDDTKPKLYSPHPLYDNFGKAITKEEAKKNLGLSNETGYILFFGFIREYKGLDLLLQAFADERLRRFPIKLLIAGEFYIDPKPYHEMIANLGISNQVELRKGFIPNTEIVNYFCASDVVAQPYKEATQSGITQIAYHFSKPIITTNVGGLAEIVPDGKVGYVVNPDYNEIADALVKYFENSNEAEFSANAAIEKKRFTWDAFIDGINGLRNQLKSS